MMAERTRRRFTAEYKTEAVKRLEEALFDYLEIFYNRRRRHSGVGFLTPTQGRRMRSTGSVFGSP
jgi:transposase InsO family protein